MEYYPFPALLRSEYGGIEEHGTALLAPGGNALNFVSEFVPLLPLGTTAEVEWVLGEKSLATFSGKTYLSSAQMVQLVEVDEDKMRTARTLFATNTRLPARVYPANRPKAKALAVEVLYLSMGLVKLLVRENIEEGSALLLNAEVDFLTLNNLELLVHKRIVLRHQEAILLCEVEGVGSDNFVALSTYVAKLTKQTAKEGEY